MHLTKLTCRHSKLHLIAFLCRRHFDLGNRFCGRVVHHVQSIGLHVEVRQGEERDEYGSTLLTCVWVIDRLNAAINGRPVIMHERDFRKDLQACFDQQSPCLRLLIKVTALLDLVIGLYRPSTDTTVNVVENRLPAFESLVMESGADNLGASFVCESIFSIQSDQFFSFRHP